MLIIIATVSILGFRGDKTRKEPLYLFPDMDRQSKFHPQGENPFYDNKMDDRLPVINTIPRGNELELAVVFSEDYSAEDLLNVELQTGRDAAGEWATDFPIDVTRDVIEMGKVKYDIFCAVCHGLAGNGQSVVTSKGLPAANLLLQNFIDQPHGEIYNTIAYGKNLMGAYGDKLSPEERWAVVLYVRALQRANQGTMEDVPDGMKRELGI